MTSAIILISIILWLVIGYKSFVYWWTEDFDYTYEDIPIAVLASIGGPITFFIGKVIHGDDSRIIKPKRK